MLLGIALLLHSFFRCSLSLSLYWYYVCKLENATYNSIGSSFVYPQRSPCLYSLWSLRCTTYEIVSIVLWFATVGWLKIMRNQRPPSLKSSQIRRFLFYHLEWPLVKKLPGYLQSNTTSADQVGAVRCVSSSRIVHHAGLERSSFSKYRQRHCGSGDDATRACVAVAAQTWKVSAATASIEKEYIICFSDAEHHSISNIYYFRVFTACDWTWRW